MSQNALKVKVKNAVTSVSSRKVLIVDDEAPDADFPPLEAWSELRDVLQQAPAIYSAYLDLCEKEGRNLSEAPAAEVVQRIVAESGSVPSPISDAVSRYTQSKHVLAQIRHLLEEVGFTVSLHPSTPEIDSAEPPFLVIVDFHFEGEAHEGENAERTIGALMHPTFRVPPFVLLMSKRLDPADCERWMKIAEKSGFFRFNYDFLPKQAIQTSAGYLYFSILNFVQHSAVSETYFQQMRTLENEAKRIAEEITKEIFQVTPPEAQMFARRMRTEGQPLGQVFTDLFVQHLAFAIENSTQVRAAMKIFEDAVSVEGLPTAEVREHGNLHKLFSQLLHSTVFDCSAAPSFGDIFESDAGNLYLVLSQECDIACGDGRIAKSERVLMLEGVLMERAANSKDGPIISKPFWEAGRTQRWIWWNLRKPAIFPYASIAPMQKTSLDSLEGINPRFHRRFKLRFAEAEEIQNAFAFNLARVATEVFPSPITKFICKIAHEGSDRSTLDGDLCFYMLEVGGDRYISVAPESKVASLGTDEKPLLPPDIALRLCRFVSISDFKMMLQQSKIVPIAVEGKLRVLFKFTTRSSRGVSEWTGK